VWRTGDVLSHLNFNRRARAELSRLFAPAAEEHSKYTTRTHLVQFAAAWCLTVTDFASVPAMPPQAKRSQPLDR
jgi:hypothetical protein